MKRRAILAPLFAWLAVCAPVQASMDEATLSGLIRGKKLGLSDAEYAQAQAVLNDDRVDVDLNKVRSAKQAASYELRAFPQDPTKSAYDGAMKLRGGAFEGDLPDVQGVAIDPKTGKPKKEKERKKVDIAVNGMDAQKALKDFMELVRQKLLDEEEGASLGQYSDFFQMVGQLFFPKPGAPKYQLPALMTDKTVLERAIATYHPGEPGLITFDEYRFPRYGDAMKRKIACHEFYHWYQDRIGALEEPSAYAVMPHC